jgi:hypothetical protein
MKIEIRGVKEGENERDLSGLREEHGLVEAERCEKLDLERNGLFW